jgi:hypothetical protein
LVEVRRLMGQSLQKKINDYVVNRQNQDGGYTFCQGAESNAQDTYYGLSIQNLLGQSFPFPEKTVEFLKSTHLDSIYSIYYVAKAFLLLDEKINGGIVNGLRSIINSKRYFGFQEVFSEVSSEFTTTFMALELANLLKMDVDVKEITEWLLSFRNGDGGFGPNGHSNINSTYYATASFMLLKSDQLDLHAAAKFVRACEKPYGGFTVTPINYEPYMEQTYFGVQTLDLLGEQCRYPSQTVDFVLSCQNSNGGFARSDLGISSFIDTYCAVVLLQKITNDRYVNKFGERQNDISKRPT